MVTVTMQYTPSRIWEVLTEGSDDMDELIDVEVAMTKLPADQRLFIRLLANGYSGLEAMRKAHMTGNQTRNKRLVLLSLSRILNEGGN